MSPALNKFETTRVHFVAIPGARADARRALDDAIPHHWLQPSMTKRHHYFSFNCYSSSHYLFQCGILQGSPPFTLYLNENK